jgi:hypothetical protein
MESISHRHECWKESCRDLGFQLTYSIGVASSGRMKGKAHPKARHTSEKDLAEINRRQWSGGRKPKPIDPNKPIALTTNNKIITPVKAKQKVLKGKDKLKTKKRK